MKAIKSDPMYRFLILLTIASAVGLQTWQTLFNNFAVEAAGLEGKHVGVIQSVREIPGFLALLSVYVLLILKEHRLSALSVCVLGIGVGCTGYFPTYGGLLIATLLMSFGFHYFETTNKSLTLQYFSKDIAPWVFGKQRSIAAASNIGAGVFIYLFSYRLSYQDLFAVAGLLIAGIGVWGFSQTPTRKDLVPQKKRMVFRSRYWLYYFLTFMAGARRQIFVAFAVFLLVRKFNYSIRDVSVLFVINNGINYFLSPFIGRCIILFGERRVLSVEYGGLVLVFLAYALVQDPILAGGLYIMDHLFFNFAMAIQTYFQKVGDPEDISPSMAVGFTINHIAAVVLPAVGGLLWMIDYRIPFWIGAGMAIVSLVAVQSIRT